MTSNQFQIVLSVLLLHKFIRVLFLHMSVEHGEFAVVLEGAEGTRVDLKK